MLTTLTLSLLTAAPALPVDAPNVDAPILRAEETVADMIARGKRAILDGDYAKALEAMKEAHDTTPTLETDVWLQRARLLNGELDEAFDRIVELEAENESSPLLAYGIGAARYAVAKREEYRRGGKPGPAYEEAVIYLGEATEGAPDAFPDAWVMLADSARWMGRSEIAAHAIDRALQVSANGPTLALAAKIRIMHGVSLLGDEATKAEGKRAVQQGVADAKGAIEAFGKKDENARWVADAALQRAVGLLYLEKKDEAAKEYARAMANDPTQVDYAQLMGTFTDEAGTLAPFVDVLGEGAKGFEKRWGKKESADAGIHWWRGYAQHRLGRNDEAIESMQTALAKFPAYTNAHWYIALSHYGKGKDSYADAVAAWRAYATADKAGFAAMVNQSDANKFYLQRAQFVLYANGAPEPTTELAAELAELLLLSDETDPANWNNVGLMHRDAGAYVAFKEPKAPMMSADDHFERAWVGYQRAIELDRRSYYLNDGAVILHYYLEREYDKAIAMYDEAEEMAQARLDAGGLTAEEKGLVEIALRDSRDNRAKLKAKIEKQKKGGDGAR